jgi:hypothetical protein
MTTVSAAIFCHGGSVEFGHHPSLVAPVQICYGVALAYLHGADYPRVIGHCLDLQSLTVVNVKPPHVSAKRLK